MPDPESTIFVVSLAPEQSWLEAAVVDVGVVVVVPPAVGVVALVGLHWNDVFCDLRGASEMLNDVWSGSR